MQALTSVRDMRVLATLPASLTAPHPGATRKRIIFISVGYAKGHSPKSGAISTWLPTLTRALLSEVTVASAAEICALTIANVSYYRRM
jgi:hypothetical protein